MEYNEFRLIYNKNSEINTCLPTWFTEEIYNALINIIKEYSKLDACKWLMSLSKSNNPDNVPHQLKEYTIQQPWGLKWAKMDVCDVIYDELKKRNQLPASATIPNDKLLRGVLLDRTIKTITYQIIADDESGLRTLLEYVPEEVAIRFLQRF